MGKLARLGQSRAQAQRAAQQQVQHYRRSMRRNLNQFLGCVRVRRGEIRHQRLVNADSFAAVIRSIDHIGQPRPPVLEGMAKPHQVNGNRCGLRAAEAHNADAAAAGWR